MIHMKTQDVQKLGIFLLKGLIIGIVATQALDKTSELLQDELDPKIRKRENKTRGNRQAYEVAVSRMAGLFNRKLSREEERRWGWRFHKAFGISGGYQYLALRQKNPKAGKWVGLPFGLLFFVVVDETMNYLLKLTPGPTHFPLQSHARGAIAHLAYGVAAESTARALERLPDLAVKEDREQLFQSAA